MKAILVFFLVPWAMVPSLFAAEKAVGPPRHLRDESRMSYLDNGEIRLGVDLTLGGAITFLSTSKDRLNVVNNHDCGRQIQMSHYSGPVPFVAGDKQPHKSWTGIGWNPIQSGDVYGNGAKVLEHRNDGRALYVKCVPMHWPLENVPGECTYECWIRLEGNTAEVRCRFQNARSDKTQYPARCQELPAVYTNGPLYRLMTYRGDRPFTADALTELPPKFPWQRWLATENWAALVRSDNWGLGIWNPDACAFSGGFAGKPGAGGECDGPTGYIAPNQIEIIDHNIDYQYRYVLILGSLESIRRYACDHRPASLLPDYRFTSDRQHWHYVHAVDAGWPIAGELSIRLEKGHPMLVGPKGCWPAKDAPTLYIEAASHVDQTPAFVYWTRSDAAKFSEKMRAPLSLIDDGQYHVYALDLHAAPGYTGSITQLRLDPAAQGEPGRWIKLKSITFHDHHE